MSESRRALRTSIHKRPATLILALGLSFGLGVGVSAHPVAAHAQSSLPAFGSSNGSSGNNGNNQGSRPAPKPAPQPERPGQQPGVPGQPSQPGAPRQDFNVTMLGDLLGVGKSDAAGFYSGDLGIMREITPGKKFAVVFGDSFRGQRFGEGEWLSPVGVVAQKTHDGRIEILEPLNDGSKVQQLVKYSHGENRLTVIPSDLLNLDGTLYMQGMWNKPFGNVTHTQVWKSLDQGATWQSVGTIDGGYKGGLLQLLSWEQGPDGWVYQVSTKFGRKHDVYLSRMQPRDLANPRGWQHYNPRTGQWESASTSVLHPVLSEPVQAGEMSLRYIQGHWVLAMFNEETLAVEVRISRELATDWNRVPVATIVRNGPWDQPQGPNNFSQPYGGYITPGSTLDNLDLVISQWNTSDNSRYNSTQFNVRGLDKFFGIAGAETVQPRALRSAPVPSPDAVPFDAEVLDVTEVAPDDNAVPQLTPDANTKIVELDDAEAAALLD